VCRNPPYGGGMLHSADYAAPKEQSKLKGCRLARLIRPTALSSEEREQCAVFVQHNPQK
jgi:hypothetical protein